MNQKQAHKIAEYYGSRQYKEAIKAANALVYAIAKYQQGIEKGYDAEVLHTKQLEISEKIADIEILLDQIKYMLSSTTEVTRLKEDKLQRQVAIVEQQREQLS